MGPNTVDDASGPVPPRERRWRHHPKDDAADQDGGAGGRAPAKRRFSGAGNTVELTLRYLNTRLDHVQGVRVAKPPPAPLAGQKTTKRHGPRFPRTHVAYR